jgi:hypothetical protein
MVELTVDDGQGLYTTPAINKFREHIYAPRSSSLAS